MAQNAKTVTARIVLIIVPTHGFFGYGKFGRMNLVESIGIQNIGNGNVVSSVIKVTDLREHPVQCQKNKGAEF